jgi:uncharacterized damage-inducible protein DinB
MTTPMLRTAFAHHVWATERLIDACSGLTREQLVRPVPGTYGPIIETLGHLVGSDGWYLSFFSDNVARIAPDPSTTLADFRSAATKNGEEWLRVLGQDLDPETDIVDRGDDGSEFHAPLDLRLAQVVHHGTDHRSQVCTALTSLGLTPPEIDLWDFGAATGRTREMPPPTA